MDQIKRIIIEGEKVHNVGYRPFLLWKIRELGIPNHDARNVRENGMERVVISVGGEEKRVQEFVEFVKENYPEKAKISRVWEVEPPERVMTVDEYQKIFDSEQHNTMIQAGLGMLGKQDQMIEMQKEALGNQRGMLEKQDQTTGAIDKLDVNVNRKFDNLDVKYGKIAEHMEKILEEMKEERKEARKSMEGILNAILRLAEKSG